ncbi:hypothetical protein ACIQVK_18800 [Streptomyces sp. NPDC090493]|uniref:hypothetical protein n=1 Tax=Streptomyces sp. NPDC090493 TaxID=3365964 RepID=UPI00382212F3
MVPQIARRLASEAAWDAEVAAMPATAGSFAPPYDYDKALSSQEENRLGFYQELLKEAAHMLFGLPSIPAR